MRSLNRNGYRWLAWLVPLVVIALSGCAILKTSRVGRWPFDRPVRAVWVWDGASLKAEPHRMEFVSFCTENRVSLVLLATRGDYQELAPLIRLCREKGMRVHALAGSPEMAVAQYHQDVASHIRAVAKYNSNCGAGAEMQGIHLDVEPYLLDGFEGDARDRIIKEYIEMLELAARHRAVRDGSLLLGADIPFWFDSRNRDGKYKYSVKGKPVHEYVMDTTDYVCLMAYRNRLKGADGVFDIIKEELQYAEKRGGHVFVGLETGSGAGIPEKTTFYGLGRKKIEESLGEIESVLATNKCFAGTAVHHYNNWRWLE